MDQLEAYATRAREMNMMIPVVPRTVRRFAVTVNAVGPGGDSDRSNNTTHLVIDVIDKNDF